MGQYDHLFGWNPRVARIANDAAPPEFQRSLNIVGAGPISRRKFFFEIARKVLGGLDIYDYSLAHNEDVTQDIGDCVSWGAKHAIEYLQCFQLNLGNWDEYKIIFSPYLYGCGRVYIGDGNISGDGSCGIWQAQAVVQYGSIPTDLPGLPKYNGKIAKQFGDSRSILDQWNGEGKKHLIKSTAKVSSWEQAVQAVINGYPVTVASNVGFEMLPRSDGFHHRSGNWGHQMCLIGVDDDGDGIPSHGIIMNNWGDVHGSLTDLRDKTIKLPPGVLRVRGEDIQIMLNADDSFAYSGYYGFPAQITSDDFASI